MRPGRLHTNEDQERKARKKLRANSTPLPERPTPQRLVTYKGKRGGASYGG